MAILLNLIIAFLILIAIYTGGKALWGSLIAENALDQIQWLLYFSIFTSSIGFMGLLINKQFKNNKNGEKTNEDCTKE